MHDLIITYKISRDLINAYQLSFFILENKHKCLLLPPKLQRRGLVFEGKMVTMERVLGYYGTCDGLL